MHLRGTCHNDVALHDGVPPSPPCRGVRRVSGQSNASTSADSTVPPFANHTPTTERHAIRRGRRVYNKRFEFGDVRNCTDTSHDTNGRPRQRHHEEQSASRPQWKCSVDFDFGGDARRLNLNSAHAGLLPTHLDHSAGDNRPPTGAR